MRSGRREVRSTAVLATGFVYCRAPKVSRRALSDGKFRGGGMDEARVSSEACSACV